MRSFLLAFLAFSFFYNTVFSAEFLQLQQRLIEIYDANKSSVVRIKAAFKKDKNTSEKNNEPKITLRIGTGFFIDKEGHILTNASTVYNAERVWIEWNGLPISTEVIGHDPRTNISILKVDTIPENVSYFNLDNLARLTPIGTLAISIGCTLDFEPAPTLGIVKGYQSSFGKRVFPTTLLRTSIPGGPGEAGSPIIDFNGSLIGILVASLPEIQSSCILPVNALLRIRDDLINQGKVNYSWFGIEVSQLNRSDVVIEKVIPNSPADNNLLKEGDVLLRVGEIEIHKVEDVRIASFNTRPGQYVNLKIKRDQKIMDIAIQVTSLPIDAPEEKELEDKESPAPDK